MKKLSIGVELIVDPLILFLDEPTTGLDAYSAEQVIQLLKTIADQGKIVITTIHQPDSQIFALFDQLLILNQGYNIYCGNKDDVLEFFQQKGYKMPKYYNPAEFLLDMVFDIN